MWWYRCTPVPDIFPEAGGVDATKRVVKVDDLLDRGGGLEDGLELGEELVWGDDGVHLGLVDPQAHPLLTQVGVEGHHREGVPATMGEVVKQK